MIIIFLIEIILTFYNKIENKNLYFECYKYFMYLGKYNY